MQSQLLLYPKDLGLGHYYIKAFIEVHFGKYLYYRLLISFWFGDIRIIEQLLQNGIYYFLADFNANAFEIVPYPFRVLQVNNIESNLITDPFSNDLLCYTYCHTVILDFLIHKSGFSRFDRGPIKTRSHTSFLIIMDLVIPDYPDQLAKPVSFSCLALVPLLFDSLVMTRMFSLRLLRFLAWEKFFWVDRVFSSTVGGRNICFQREVLKIS